MEKERLAREKEEQEKAERAKKLREEFGDRNNQWEQDKSDMQKLTKQDGDKVADPA
jgi:mannan polymerase II complex ANP1 subunit